MGRENALAQLHEWLAKALRGERQIVFVSGEAGIGKTALIQAFMASVQNRTELRLTYGQCIEQYGAGEAYLPLLEAANRLCRAPGGQRIIAALQKSAPTWLAQMPGLLNVSEFETLQRRIYGFTHERMLREMSEAVEMNTSKRGLVVVLEDLHWCDTATLEWLSYIAHRREPARLLVIGTYRLVKCLRAGTHCAALYKNSKPEDWAKIYGCCHSKILPSKSI